MHVMKHFSALIRWPEASFHLRTSPAPLRCFHDFTLLAGVAIGAQREALLVAFLSELKFQLEGFQSRRSKEFSPPSQT